MGILRPRSRSEIDFLDKNLEKSRKDINPPLVSFCRDITQVAKRGGRVTWDSDFFEDFFLKIDFWATTWSQDAQNIFLETLEIFWKIPKKIFQNFHPGHF